VLADEFGRLRRGHVLSLGATILETPRPTPRILKLLLRDRKGGELKLSSFSGLDRKEKKTLRKAQKDEKNLLTSLKRSIKTTEMGRARDVKKVVAGGGEGKI